MLAPSVGRLDGLRRGLTLRLRLLPVPDWPECSPCPGASTPTTPRTSPNLWSRNGRASAPLQLPMDRNLERPMCRRHQLCARARPRGLPGLLLNVE